MRKSLYISPSVLDFALTVYSSQNLCFVASSFCRSVILLLRRSVAPLLCRSVAPLLCRSIALLLCQSVAPSLRHSVATSLRRSVALLLCRSSLRRSFAPSIAPYTITLFFFSFLYFNIQTHPRTGTCGDELNCDDGGGPAGCSGGTGADGREVYGLESSPRIHCPRTRLGDRSGASRSLPPATPLGSVPHTLRWPWKRRFH